MYKKKNMKYMKKIIKEIVGNVKNLIFDIPFN